LRWFDPTSYLRAGRRIGEKGTDLLVLVLVVPFHAPSLVMVASSARRVARSCGHHPRVVVIAHNVLPHEAHLGARLLVSALLRTADRVVTHSAEQRRLASSLGAPDAVAVDMPPHLPGGVPDGNRPRRGESAGPVRYLFFGLVRPYKGVDLLLDAVRDVPDVSLTIAGELWDPQADTIRALCRSPELTDRVTLRESYVRASDIPAMMADHDAVVLPYRSATASQHVLMAHAYGMPVIASNVGSFPEQVRDGVDGILVPPDDREALVAALRRLSRREVLDSLGDKVPVVDIDGPWQRYLDAIKVA
jgi:glycosyltransferase involved in cell wall biosynthesis